jgi:tetratricopeptide (TPR) repeat protein/transcriptional regulator with XRE-family HTH domain
MAMLPDGDVGTLLRGYRQRALLTQEELAVRTGLSARTIRRLESGELRRPRVATLRTLGRYLELSASEQAMLLASTDQVSAEYSRMGPPRSRYGCDQLPADIVDFIGRSDVLDKIRAALCSGMGAGAVSVRNATLGTAVTPTVGVTGPPGVGKSALAIRVGHMLGRYFPDGRIYLDLFGATDRLVSTGEALNRLLRWCLGGEAELPEDLDERAALYRSTLATRRVLIILDNAGTEAQVRPLLPGGAHCAVLLTSRRPLAALDGLTAFDLDLFPPGDAIALLARILGPDRIADDPAAAADIAALCGYLPLALRIAATRLRTRPHWTLLRMARWLSDEERRLDALSVGDRAVRASIGLSYDALGLQQRRLFRLLGSLTDTEVPAWVAGTLLDLPEPRAEDVLEELVDLRLVDAYRSDPATAGRYGMHSLVRLYAHERCMAEDSDGERMAASVRMVGCWLNLADRAESLLPGGLRRLGRGMGPRSPVPDERVAEAVAAPLNWFEAHRPALAGAVQTACRMGLDELAWDLAGCLGRFLEIRSYFDLWQSILDRALVAVRVAGNRRGEAHLLRGIAEVRLDLDDYAEAYDCLSQSLTIFEELGESLAEAHVHRAMGVLDRMRGDNADAGRRLERALAVFRDSDDRVGLADTLFSLGALRRDQGRTDEALVWYRQALALEEQLGNRFNQSLLMCSIGSALIAQRRVEEARTVLVRAVALARDLQHSEAFALAFLGEADTLAGDTAAASRNLASAWDIFQRCGDRYGEAITLRNLGVLFRVCGELDRSRIALGRALELWDELDTPLWRARTLVALGRLHLEMSDRASARTVLQSAADLYTRLGSDEGDEVHQLLQDVDAVSQGASSGADRSDQPPLG